MPALSPSKETSSLQKKKGSIQAAAKEKEQIKIKKIAVNQNQLDKIETIEEHSSEQSFVEPSANSDSFNGTLHSSIAEQISRMEA